MAVLCDDLNLLLICVPKTASTAVSDILIKHFKGRWVPPDQILDDRTNKVKVSFKHTRVEQLLSHNLITSDHLARLHTVAVTRNPFDWIVSQYVYHQTVYRNHFQKKVLVLKQEAQTAVPISTSQPRAARWWWYIRPEQIQDAGTMPFDDYVKKYFAADRRIFSVHQNYTEGAEVTVLRYENLQQEFAKVLKEAGVDKPPKLEHLNKTKGRHKRYQDYYSPKSQEIVSRAFASDLEQFHYNFQQSRAWQSSATN